MADKRDPLELSPFLTPRAIPPGVYDTAEAVVIGPDGKPMPRLRILRPEPEIRTVTVYRVPKWWPILLPVGLILFLAGLFIGADVESTRPENPASDPGFVNVEGHEGETLVVGPNLQLRWCEATDHACHGTTDER
jgi:hypothetical protein